MNKYILLGVSLLVSLLDVLFIDENFKNIPSPLSKAKIIATEMVVINMGLTAIFGGTQ